MERAVNATRAQHHSVSFLSQKAFHQLNAEHTQNCAWHPLRADVQNEKHGMNEMPLTP